MRVLLRARRVAGNANESGRERLLPEDRRLARRLRPPLEPRPRQHEPPLRARDRDVHQPPLLVCLQALELLLRLGPSHSRSPRSANGRRHHFSAGFSLFRSLGMTRSARPGTKTTSHSSPFARCIVIRRTAFSSAARISSSSCGESSIESRYATKPARSREPATGSNPAGGREGGDRSR
jgi:hypothetical protein